MSIKGLIINKLASINGNRLAFLTDEQYIQLKFYHTFGRFMVKDFVKSVKGTEFPKYFDKDITQEEFDNYQRRREVNTWAYGSEKLAEETANTAVEPDNSEPIDGGSENNDGDNK